MLKLFLYLSVPSILMFVLLRKLRRSPNKTQADCVTYDVMERASKRIALRNPSRCCWWMGLIYAGLFYLSVPVLIWRYGLYRSLSLVLIPIVISFGFSQLIAVTFDLDAMFTGFAIIICFRAIGGLYVVSNDLKYRKIILGTRGWNMIGSCAATSEQKATDFFQHSPKKSDPEIDFNRMYGTWRKKLGVLLRN